MKKIMLSLIVLSLILIVGCQSKPVCNKPYILVGIDCCLDQNNNAICDTDEESKPKEQLQEQSTPSTPSENATSKPEEVKVITPSTCVDLTVIYPEKEPYQTTESYTDYDTFNCAELMNRIESGKITSQEALSYDCALSTSMADLTCQGSCTVEIEKTRTITKYRDIKKTTSKRLCGDEIEDFCIIVNGDIQCPVCEAGTSALADLICKR